MTNVAINGFGRIGRLFFRQAFEKEELNIVAINDLGDIENLAYLLQYDSAYNKYPHDVTFKRDERDDEGGILIVDGKEIPVFSRRDPAELPWKDLDVDVVVEATGAFTTFEAASVHTEKAGAKHVVISAPAKDEEGVRGGKTVLMGVNNQELESCSISSNGSCTTNAATAVAALMDIHFGVEKAFLTTVHGYTATQSLVDGPARGKDFRKARAAAVNIIPSTTGAAIAVTRALTNLKGKFDGIAMRVPVITGSIVDFTFVTKKDATPEEINDVFKKAAKSDTWKGILGVTEDQLVSSDIIASPYGSMVDLGYTKVTGGNLCKVLAWYDNEWGYTTTLVQHVIEAGKKSANMKIYLATDHAGFALKEYIKALLTVKGHEVVDCGAERLDEDDDYPVYIKKAAEAVANNPEDRAIIFGGSGQGEAMVANRYKGVRATVYYGGNEDIIRLSREHNDANVLSLGARFLSEDEASEVVNLWLETSFSNDERHQRRIEQF